MRLQIDTTQKVIKIEEQVNFGELIEKVKKLLPGEWKEYKLETNSVIQWTNPVVIQEWPFMPAFPSYPYWWTQPYSGMTFAETVNTDVINGIVTTNEIRTQYCIEC